jgi:hypothetical protein
VVGLTLEDRLEILELLSRYNLAADDKDVEAMVADFTEDGVIEGFYVTGQGKEAIRRDLPAIFEAEGTLKRHLALNPRMVGDGETAEVSYVLLSSRGRRGLPWGLRLSSATSYARWGTGGWSFATV